MQYELQWLLEQLADQLELGQEQEELAALAMSNEYFISSYASGLRSDQYELQGLLEQLANQLELGQEQEELAALGTGTLRICAHVKVVNGLGDLAGSLHLDGPQRQSRGAFDGQSDNIVASMQHSVLVNIQANTNHSAKAHPIKCYQSMRCSGSDIFLQRMTYFRNTCFEIAPLDLISGLATRQNTTVSRRLTFDEVMPHTKAVARFEVPNPRSGQATVDYKDVTLGGEVGFDVASVSLTKYTDAIDNRSINGIDVCRPSYTKDVLMETDTRQKRQKTQQKGQNRARN
ncbi:hypothetical protein Tco_0890515 [Tanacetum coccineum]|uniref:Uncharacterized protein n=1 Tax=Tanacetum coccineum TaxID=301880 RepID=A0ABQ5C3I1_9ASTR